MTTRFGTTLARCILGGATLALLPGCSQGSDPAPEAPAPAAESAAPSPSEALASGLVLSEITPGSGASPGPRDTVKVHYHGTFPDGRVFDSSVARGQPATFPLNRVIKCWTEGLQLMKVGGKALLICPSEIAYGARGRPPKIPGGSTLHFEVELLAIQ